MQGLCVIPPAFGSVVENVTIVSFVLQLGMYRKTNAAEMCRMTVGRGKQFGLYFYIKTTTLMF